MLRDARFALVTDGSRRGTAETLRRAGADVVGLLGPDPMDSFAWAAAEQVAAAYVDINDLLTADCDVIVVDTQDVSSVYVGLAALRAGRHVVFGRPQAVLRADAEDILPLAQTDERLALVALPSRAWPAARVAAARLAELGGIAQATVTGWPAARRPELVDLVSHWFGEVVAICAAPEALPAPKVGSDAATLSLLMSSGATVLAAESSRVSSDHPGGGALFTVIGAEGRLVLTGDLVKTQQDGEIAESLCEAPGSSLEPPVRALVADLGGPQLPGDGAGAGAASTASASSASSAIWAASVGELVAAQRIAELGALSYDEQRWIEI
jgi:predicted dehydrogenase